MRILILIVLLVVLIYLSTSGDPIPAWFIVASIVGVIVVFAEMILFGNDRSKGNYQLSYDEKRLFDKGMVYRNGYEYELYVAYILERKGYKNVYVTQATGDFGADIICHDRNGKKIAVQCKMYSKPVGYKAVEEALGAMHYYSCDQAMVVTNNTFTKQAQTAADKVGVKLMSGVK